MAKQHVVWMLDLLSMHRMGGSCSTPSSSSRQVQHARTSILIRKDIVSFASERSKLPPCSCGPMFSALSYSIVCVSAGRSNITCIIVHIWLNYTNQPTQPSYRHGGVMHENASSKNHSSNKSSYTSVTPEFVNKSVDD